MIDLLPNSALRPAKPKSNALGSIKMVAGLALMLVGCVYLISPAVGGKAEMARVHQSFWLALQGNTDALVEFIVNSLGLSLPLDYLLMKSTD